MKIITFSKYCEMRANEGLWLNDKNAVLGLSKIAPPMPTRKTTPKQSAAVKPIKAPSPMKTLGEDQLPDAMTALNRLGIDLLPPRDDEIRKIVEKDKRRLPRRVVRTPSGGVAFAPQPSRN